MDFMAQNAISKLMCRFRLKCTNFWFHFWSCNQIMFLRIGSCKLSIIRHFIDHEAYCSWQNIFISLTFSVKEILTFQNARSSKVVFIIKI